MGKVLRFAAGERGAAWSSIWRVIAEGNEVYVGPSKLSMGFVKLSLHSSGVWVLAATGQSGGSFGDNRRAKQWQRPPEHAPGVVRGPSVLVPNTTQGTRPILEKEMRKAVVWVPGPQIGHLVDFGMYFVAPHADFAPDGFVVGELQLLGGDRVVIIATSRPMDRGFEATVERRIREAEVQADAFRQGAHIWATQSADELRVPMLVDLPVRVVPTIAGAVD